MQIMSDEDWHRYENGRKTREAEFWRRPYNVWPRLMVSTLPLKTCKRHPNAHNPAGRATLGGHTQ